MCPTSLPATSRPTTRAARPSAWRAGTPRSRRPSWRSGCTRDAGNAEAPSLNRDAVKASADDAWARMRACAKRTCPSRPSSVEEASPSSARVISSLDIRAPAPRRLRATLREQRQDRSQWLRGFGVGGDFAKRCAHRLLGKPVEACDPSDSLSGPQHAARHGPHLLDERRSHERRAEDLPRHRLGGLEGPFEEMGEHHLLLALGKPADRLQQQPGGSGRARGRLVGHDRPRISLAISQCRSQPDTELPKKLGAGVGPRRVAQSHATGTSRRPHRRFVCERPMHVPELQVEGIGHLLEVLPAFRKCLRRVYGVLHGCRPGARASRRVISPTIAHLTIATEVFVSRS